MCIPTRPRHNQIAIHSTVQFRPPKKKSPTLSTKTHPQNQKERLRPTFDLLLDAASEAAYAQRGLTEASVAVAVHHFLEEAADTQVAEALQRMQARSLIGVVALDCMHACMHIRPGRESPVWWLHGEPTGGGGVRQLKLPTLIFFAERP